MSVEMSLSEGASGYITFYDLTIKIDGHGIYLAIPKDASVEVVVTGLRAAARKLEENYGNN